MLKALLVTSFFSLVSSGHWSQALMLNLPQRAHRLESGTNAAPVPAAPDDQRLLQAAYNFGSQVSPGPCKYSFPISKCELNPDPTSEDSTVTLARAPIPGKWRRS